MSVPDLSWQAVFGTSSVRELLPLGIAGVVVWSLWLYRAIGSRPAAAVVHRLPTSTPRGVPSYREDAEILATCARSWLSQDPSEVIVVVDVADTDCQEALAAIQGPPRPGVLFTAGG